MQNDGDEETAPQEDLIERGTFDWTADIYCFPPNISRNPVVLIQLFRLLENFSVCAVSTLMS